MPEPASERIDETVPVLVVGGGLVGLSTALFLAAHGVPPLLVEKHPDLLIHPRARGFSPRTVELFREVGLGPAIRHAGYADPDRFRWVAVRAETLAGEHAPVPEPTTAGFDEASPARFAPIDQDVLERLIRAKVEALGGDLRFSTELVRFGRDGAGVAALVRDRRTGEERTIHADYLVAADGHASPIRQTLGIGVDGPGPFFDILTATIDADLRPALRGRTASIAYLERPRPGTSLLAHDETGRRWVFGLGYAADRETPADYPDERIAGLVREAAGLDGVAVTLRPQIPGTDLKVLGWTIGAHLARAYRSGPVFLAGDAAHAVPPTGGFGANLGIQDAHNLAWKLAAVLRGQAGPGLLATYEAERRPVAS
ncbi:MAG TPA: FAD-dependent monooxygenase, partial [Thermomicrobiales bacterium]|nr:FAD-dependent monooxygenase [Thermomicrobiales bacterium]